MKKLNLFFILTLVMFLFTGSSVGQTTKRITDEEVVWTTLIKSQGESGGCALYSDISFLESELYRLGIGEFELSTMYIIYHFYIEKALRNIRLHRASDFGFNGGFNYDAFEMIKKYGVVPLSDYTGMLPGQTDHNHKVFIKKMNIWLNEVEKTGKEGKLNSKWENGKFYCPWLDSIKNILNENMGKPPTAIEYKKKTMSPKQFSDDILSIPYDDYISVTSYSYLAFYEKGELLVSGNWLHRDNFYNVKIDEFIGIIDYALQNGFSLTGDFHITEELYMNGGGYTDLDIKDIKPEIDQDTRDNLYENWITNDVHNVHIIGIAKDQNGKKYYKIKDSSPEDVFPNKPIYFSENYFRARVLAVMLHKDGIPRNIRKKLKID